MAFSTLSFSFLCEIVVEVNVGWWRRCCGSGGGGRGEGGGRGVVIVVVVEVMDVSVVAGHRADVFCRFWEPHRAGEVLSIFFK